MSEYKETQIIKHALQSYIKRTDATEKEVEEEKRLLKKYTDRAKALKEKYGIGNKIIKRCKFDMAWIGECNKETIKGSDYCEEHLDLKCCVCGKQATHSCTWASSLSCGAPLCDSKKCRDKHGH